MEERFFEDEDQKVAMAETFKMEEILEDPEYYVPKTFQFFVGFEHRKVAIKDPIFITVKYTLTHHGIGPYEYTFLPALVTIIEWSEKLNEEIKQACLNNFQSLGHKL